MFGEFFFFFFFAKASSNTLLHTDDAQTPKTSSKMRKLHKTQPTLACPIRCEMTSTLPVYPSSTSTAIEFIKHSLSQSFASPPTSTVSRSRTLAGSRPSHANRHLVLLIHQLLCSVLLPDSLPTTATTTLKDLAANLSTAT
jgi:hypothetical protein